MATHTSWMCSGYASRDRDWLWIDPRFISCYRPDRDYDQTSINWSAHDLKVTGGSVASRWCRTLTDYMRRDPLEKSAQKQSPWIKQFGSIQDINWSGSNTTTSRSSSSDWRLLSPSESSLDRQFSTSVSQVGDTLSHSTRKGASGTIVSDESWPFVTGTWNLLTPSSYTGSSPSLNNPSASGSSAASSSFRWKQFKHAGRNWRRRLYGRYLDMQLGRSSVPEPPFARLPSSVRLKIAP